MTEILAGDEFQDLQERIPDTKVAPAVGIAAIALSMALKYHDINTVQDGALYQQFKLEGRNMTPLYLHAVFDTALQIERHLLGASERIAQIVVEALEAPDAESDASENAQSSNERGEANQDSASLRQEEREDKA